MNTTRDTYIISLKKNSQESETRKRRTVRALLLAVIMLMAGVQWLGAQAYLPRSAPEAQGVHSADVKEFLDKVVMSHDGNEIHSVMVLRNGQVIGEVYVSPFAKDFRHTLYSCSKTFTALAVGLAVDNNLLRVTDRLGALLPDKFPSLVSDNLANLTVADLLTMSSGITPDWEMRNKHRDWAKTWLAKPIETPGQKFAYDSMDTYLLSEVVQRLTGKTVLEYLNENIFKPMSITDVEWEESPDGVNTGGWGVHTIPETMAKIGQLLLNNGRWDDRQLLSERWVKEMMTPHRQANPSEQYGYQMWQCAGRKDAWRADGAYGQYIVVVPDKQMVAVITQASQHGPEVLKPLWELADKAADEALEENPEAVHQLVEHQKKFELTPPDGARASRMGTLVQNKTFLLPSNSLDWKSLTFELQENQMLLKIVTTAGRSYTVKCGYKEWLTDYTSVQPPYTIKAEDRFRGIRRYFAVSGSYAWLPDGTLTFRVVWPSWITGAYISFNPATKTMTIKENVEAKAYTLRVV